MYENLLSVFVSGLVSVAMYQKSEEIMCVLMIIDNNQGMILLISP